MLLMIDNYDSFTYNLVQYLGELGADVLVQRNDAITLEQVEAWAPERIVISPGPCTPAEAGISVPLIRRFVAATGGSRLALAGTGVSPLRNRSPRLQWAICERGKSSGRGTRG